MCRKVNTSMWRLLPDWLPLRQNLVDKGFDVHMLLCSICLGDMKDMERLFLKCEVLVRTSNKISRWVGVNHHIMDFISKLMS